ncbi:type I-E CRISPR-associated protein Cas6/Cse3/CasE [Nocardia neocaledoniensis]|uniref:type I-E CRISPR-associated protein Cas6/Cse3/CasE n=1 Tax=Nocardia neocaledoniensis TaxID=236511 RepID=UPI003CC57F87
MRHVATRFDGIATIHDVDLVRSAVADGIGRGKSYGCGLLSLLPANSEAPADSDSAGEERGTSPHR